MSSEVFEKLLLLVDGGHIPFKSRDIVSKKAYIVYYRFKRSLSCGSVENPITGKTEKRIIFHTDKKLIVLKSEETVSCIDFFYKRCKAESARKLKKRIDSVFCGVTEREIQAYINNSRKSQRVKGRFENKPKLKPVTSDKVWDRVQIDLMSMIDMPVEKDHKKHQWVLSCIDVFSRYLLLKPLHSKDTAV